jgi:hypothetical protein
MSSTAGAGDDYEEHVTRDVENDVAVRDSRGDT